MPSEVSDNNVWVNAKQKQLSMCMNIRKINVCIKSRKIFGSSSCNSGF